MVGCGNAPMSIDMYLDGYSKLWNTDISSVVINIQNEKYPEMKWTVQDAMNTGLKENSMECIIDKSLIDTLMCATKSAKQLKKFMDEMYRIQKPNTMFITFSLHQPHEVIKNFEPNNSKYHWKVDYYRIKSSRWNEDENRRTSVSHTLIVCEKFPLHITIPEESRVLKGTLTEEEFKLLQIKRFQVIGKYAYY